ncbi:hypothetical protein [Streptomyces syringium]
MSKPIITPPPAGAASGGLLRSKTAITAARGRNVVPSDGGGTGKSDSND